MTARIGIFDLDGTLIDSDAALTAPFVALGVAPDEVTFGHVLADECARLGIGLTAYLDHYDPTAARPFPGVEQLVASLGRWAVCSNKHPRSGQDELARLGWAPEIACFSDAFDGPKQLGPVLDAMDLTPAEVVFIGDTGHDRACAHLVGCEFVLAGWNPRAEPHPGDRVALHPAEVRTLLEG